MELRCIDICPLPSNNNNPVDIIDCGIYTEGGGFGTDTPIRRVHRFSREVIFNSPYQHKTSVLVPEELKDGTTVPDNAQACDAMTEYFNYRRSGGTIGGSIICKHSSSCDYGSGQRS